MLNLIFRTVCNRIFLNFEVKKSLIEASNIQHILSFNQNYKIKIMKALKGTTAVLLQHTYEK